MFSRVSWAAALAAAFSVGAVVAGALTETALAVGLGLGGVTWAILSLKE